MEKTRYDVRKIFQMGAHSWCWYGGRFCLWTLSGINSVLFLFCILCILHFLYFVNIPCASCEKYSPPQIRHTNFPKLGTRVRLIWGDEAYTETNFTPVFLFVMYDVYVATVSSFIKLSFSCVFEKFYDIFLSLIAVWKNLPILGDFPPQFLTQNSASCNVEISGVLANYKVMVGVNLRPRVSESVCPSWYAAPYRTLGYKIYIMYSRPQFRSCTADDLSGYAASVIIGS